MFAFALFLSFNRERIQSPQLQTFQNAHKMHRQLKIQNHCQDLYFSLIMNASTLDLLRSFVESYVKPPVKEEPVAVEVKEEVAAAPPAEDKCTSLGCKKKAKWDCVHKYDDLCYIFWFDICARMCFPCCAAVKEANPECELCSGHLSIYKRIQGTEALMWSSQWLLHT